MSLTAKILAFYFLLGSLFPKTDFGQLAHISQMINHYEQHRISAQQAGTSFSLLLFLQQHFLDPSSHEHGDDTHNQLPLKHFHGLINYFLESAEPALPFSPQYASNTLFAQKEAILSGFLTHLFRPPLG